MLCGQMPEYDVEFNVPSQTLECGIVSIQLLTAEEGLNIKPEKWWPRRR